MENDKVNKHIQLSKELYDKFLTKVDGKFQTLTKGFEYYLEMGMKFEDSKNREEKILYDINYCLKEIKYTKKLMEQYMANKGFPCNKKISEDKCIIDFRKNIYKDDFND